MAGKKGILPSGVQLMPLMDGGTPRCQRVRQPYDEEGNPLPGVQCKRTTVQGRPYCSYHGGKSNGPLKTGKYSKYNPLPKNLQKRFEESLENPDLLNLTKSIALLDSQIWQICEDASEQDNFTPLQRKQLSLLLKEHRELVSAETDRRIAMGSLMDIGEVMRIINFVYDSIVRNIQDNSIRARISADLRSIVTGVIPGKAFKDEDQQKDTCIHIEDESTKEVTIIDAGP